MTTSECLLCTTELKTTPSWSQLFSRFQPTICPRCNDQFEPLQKTYTIANNLEVHCLYKYNEKMIDYLHRYKFMHDTVLAAVFQRQIYEALKSKTVVPIPMHPQKLQQRTFHHIEYMLQAASIRYESLLTKTTTETQGTKSRQERLQTSQFFELKQKPQAITYTLFDDIVTTGTTLLHAKNALLEGGATEVHCLALIKA